MEKQSGATDTKEVSKTDVLTPVKIMYTNMVMPRQWYNTVLSRTLFVFLFIFTQNSPHSYYNCNFKKQFLHREFKSKGDCLFYIVELDYLFSKI